ncbi:MAG: zinc-binding dehydrogenase [Acidimicrobiales bacterium]|nr:zinc-binding dehydrogenase [Acidimicrobiales bacterium]
MWAIRQHAFGGPEQLHYEEVPDPEPGAGQVRVRVSAAGVHVVDTAIRRGEPGPFPPPDLPMTPGREVAGSVDRTGDGVDPSWLGRAVVVHLGMASGGYAELALAEASSLQAVPDGLDADGAVAMIGTGRTTMSILDRAAPTTDDVVLVTAAAGGIGTLLVQAAVGAGATVVAAAGGPHKVDVARGLGADVAVDYDRPDWPEEVRAAVDGRDVSLVYESVGGRIGEAAVALLGAGGTLAVNGWSSGTPLEIDEAALADRGVQVAPWVRPTDLRPLEDRALAAAASGALTPVVGPPFDLADAADAHRAVETRATIGKTVLHP